MANFTERKTVLLKSGQGERGEAAENDTTIPEDGIIMFDGSTAPTGYEETTAPTPEPPTPTHDYIVNYDFTQSLVDGVTGLTLQPETVTYEQGVGLKATSGTQRQVVAYNGNLLNGNTINSLIGYTVEVDFGSMSKQGSANARLTMVDTTNGFVYRNSNVWGYYANSWVSNLITPEVDLNDGNLFANATLKMIYRSSSTGGLDIYKDDKLVYRPNTNAFFTDLFIGANGNAYYNMVIKGLRMYPNEE